jgi:ribosomal protein S27AE
MLELNMTGQLKIVNLKCANCGGALEISGDMQRFACGYCGSEQIVERRGGTIALRLVVDAVACVQVGTDKTAAELALVRLDKELGIARVRWQEAYAEFFRRNDSNMNLGVALMILSAIVFLPAFIAFLIAVGAFDIGQIFFSGLFAGGAIFVFIRAYQINANARARFRKRLSEMSSPQAKQIQGLEMQIEKQRRLVHS